MRLLAQLCPPFYIWRQTCNTIIFFMINQFVCVSIWLTKNCFIFCLIVVGESHLNYSREFNLFLIIFASNISCSAAGN